MVPNSIYVSADMPISLGNYFPGRSADSKLVFFHFSLVEVL
jgi:hypothetical protein